MILLDEATKDWAMDGVWKIAPTKLSWISEGARVCIGKGASIGEGTSIGAWASIGEGTSIGAWVSIGEGAFIGAWVSIGEGTSIGAEASIGERAFIGAWASIGGRASIGEGTSIGAWASIGEGTSIGAWASIGAKSSEAVDLGWADGYRKCVAQVDGVAYIGAGVWWFTLTDALNHWADKPDRELTMCLMMAAVHIAGLRGWSHE